MKKFSKDHEWIEVNDDIGTIGISDYAQKQLGDVVYVSPIKEVNTMVNNGDEIAEIESVKSVSQVYSPVNGKIMEYNSIFEDESNSGIINEDPYDKGWIFKIKLEDQNQINSLMDEEEYQEFISNL
jgi:glycine cleavage system H protein